MDIHTIWAQTMHLLKEGLTEAVMEGHIKPLVPHSYEGGQFVLRTDSDFNKDTINKRYLFEIRRCLYTTTKHEDIDVSIVSPQDFNEGPSRQLSDNYAKTGLRHKYIFETFVEGKCNQLAHAAAIAVSKAPGQDSAYNPLFLYGGVGLGKTHLMQSIGNYVIEQNPHLKVRYVSTETFTNELVAAIRDKTTEVFKNKYRDCDLLLMDDVQFLERTQQTQEEIFHTFNDLYNTNKQLVFTSDQPPNKIPKLESRISSRFTMGLMADITMPDYETRTAILEKKLRREQLEIPEEVKEFIIRNVISNIRDLEGALNKITAYARLSTTPITLELAVDALKDQLTGSERPAITIPYIQQIVANHFSITTEDLIGRRKTQDIVWPRHIAMYLCRKLMDISLPAVGKSFNRDHTTVIHSCEKISNELDSDPKLHETLLQLERSINGE